ncbi:MAG TPA: FlgD immunoglobulin-like domain containing protein [Spirochaetota bacterium]|nr:FlgD immunoglobulin-like domain containing protein [Spirochaetota bacterium]
MKKIILLTVFFVNLINALPEKAVRYFSPNLDGSKDTIPIPLNIQENNELKKWKVLIYQKEGTNFEVIRTYESMSAVEIKKMTFKKFMQRIFSPNEPVKIPEYIRWDGIKQVKQKDTTVSTKCSDGVYYFRIVAIDKADNIKKSPLVPIVIDTVIPKASPKPRTDIFSPNGDGNKETITFDITGSDLRQTDKLVLKIKANNNTIKKFQLNAAAVLKSRASVTWDGKADDNSKAPENIYQVTVTASDKAGNKHTSAPLKITLVRTIETITLETSYNEFAPNNNGFYDNLTFNLDTSSEKGLQKWELRITAASKNKPARVFSGGDELLQIINFDGKDKQGHIIPDGPYQAVLECWYDSGNNPSSKVKAIYIDRKAPEINLSMEHHDFIPVKDAKGRKTITIKQSVKGRGNEVYTASIINQNGLEALKINYGSNVPPAYTWDGKNQAGNIIPGTYNYILTGKDIVGNKNTVASGEFRLIGEKSDVSCSLDTTAFSPNNDNNQDTITFKVEATGKERVKQQKITIKSPDGKTVKTFNFAKYKANVTWDGKNESGETVRDGRYSYDIKFIFSTGEKPAVKNRFFFVDTQPVKIDLKLPHPVFSPNDDGNIDTLTVLQHKHKSTYNDRLDEIKILIKDRDGQIYRQREKPWRGDIPEKVIWPGTDQLKNPAPEGTYFYILDTTDAAGNKKTFKKKFELVRSMEKVDITLSDFIISLNPDNDSRKNIEMVPSFSSQKYLEAYAVYLLDMTGNKIKIASRKPQENINWQGNDINGNPLASGKYYLYCEGIYKSGNRPTSETKDITVDSKKPFIQINTRPEYFSPDNDGIDDRLEIGLQIDDNIAIAATSMLVYRKKVLDQNNDRFPQKHAAYEKAGLRPFKTWKGSKAVNKVITWDGKGDNGELVESANDYMLFVKAKDTADNQSIKKHEIPVDVLVTKLPDGRLKIIINNINFKTGSDKMIADYEKILAKLIRMLRKRAGTIARMTIVGHTDSRGSASYNQELSEKRAERVYRHLVRHDISESMLTYKGMGEKELLIKKEKVPGDKYQTEENYRKNRRVEFYLTRKEKK